MEISDQLLDNETGLETISSRSRDSERSDSRDYRRGQWVEIRSEEEIRATLDAEGKLEGLSFMPEQVKFCGWRFRIHSRADRVFLDYHYYVSAQKDLVLLENLRCDGSSHGHCQMKCLMFWKEAWLRPIASPSEETFEAPTTSDSSSTLSKDSSDSIGHVFSCQATQLAKIGNRISGWDLRQYWEDWSRRNRTFGQILSSLVKQAKAKCRRMFFRPLHRSQAEKKTGTRRTPLNLQPGEWVEVKSYEEIKETLNADHRLRGLSFSPDMIHACGKRLRVADRVEQLILEWTGEMKKISDTVILENSHCDGSAFRGCPRFCYFLWREDWLKRVSDDSN